MQKLREWEFTPLSENDMRSDEMVKEKDALYLKDVERLLRHRDAFVRVACPACDATDARKAWEKYGLTYETCRRCETVYVNPRPTPAHLEEYYRTAESYQYWNKFIFPSSEEVRRAHIFRPRVERITEICSRYGIRTERFIEVGGGYGTFSEEVQRSGVFRQVLVVEPTPDLAETCRRKGLEVIEKPIEEVSLAGRGVNVVASFEVIEHLFSPRQFVLGCAGNLSPGGLLVLSCPNIKGFDILVMGRESQSVDTEHLNYFTPDSLGLLAESCGLEVLEAITPGKLDAEIVRKKTLNGQFSLEGQPYLQQVLLQEWDRVGQAFQRFLAEQRLSSHLWLVARTRT